MFEKLFLFSNTFYDQTSLHPLGLMAVLVLGCAMLLLPRRYALLPMIVMACFIATGQRIVVATLSFDLLRIMLLFGWARLLVHSEFNGIRWKTIDTVFVVWALCSTLVMITYHSSMLMVVNRLGFLYDAFGMYFLFRFLIRDWRDVESLTIGMALVSLPVAFVFFIEQQTGRNMFAIFGGVPEITTVRDGQLRCRGAFSHPISAGCFWAAVIPLIATLWWRGGQKRILGVVGVLAAVFVVMSTSSSTPIMAMLLGCSTVLMFPVRRLLGVMRIAAVPALIGLQLMMVNPIWHLISRVDIISGSTGWYRYKLIDVFVEHFSDWWLMGTDQYTTWWEFDSITNQYALEGINGGLITLIAFILLLVIAFRGVGRTLRTNEAVRLRQIVAWAIGMSLFTHCIAFIGVSYFDQIRMQWYLILAIIGTLAPAHAAQVLPALRLKLRKHENGITTTVPLIVQHIAPEAETRVTTA